MVRILLPSQLSVRFFKKKKKNSVSRFLSRFSIRRRPAWPARQTPPPSCLPQPHTFSLPPLMRQIGASATASPMGEAARPGAMPSRRLVRRRARAPLRWCAVPRRTRCARRAHVRCCAVGFCRPARGRRPTGREPLRAIVCHALAARRSRRGEWRLSPPRTRRT
jgi:hypothetical protein